MRPQGRAPGLLTTADALVDRRLFAARSDEVEELTLETVPPGLVVELARMGRGWHERKPSDREILGTEIDTMNDLVTKLTHGESLTVAPPSGDAGAFAARARVRVKRGSSNVEEIVEMGPGNELVRRAFDGAVLRVPPALGRRLWPSEIALRGRTVFESFANLAPSAVTTDCDGVRQSVTREANQWKMLEPRGFAADALATADLVGLVRNAQAESWGADEDDGSFGLAESRCRVGLELVGEAGTRALGIVFGKEAEGGTYYARATGERAVFLAPRGLRDGAATWLIDRGVFLADAASVSRVTLSRGTVRAVFAGRRGGAEGDAHANDTASRVLDALEGLRPDAVIHLGAPRPGEGFGAPTLDVRVKKLGDGGAKELHFVLGDTALVSRERVVYARVDGVDATYGIARDRVVALVDAL